jgi:hypothetical protein
VQSLAAAGQHPPQHIVLVDQVVLERGADVAGDDGGEQEIQGCMDFTE